MIGTTLWILGFMFMVIVSVSMCIGVLIGLSI